MKLKFLKLYYGTKNWEQYNTNYQYTYNINYIYTILLIFYIELIDYVSKVESSFF